jgi:hypothetical protein
LRAVGGGGGEEWIGATDQRQVMAQVLRGLGQVHRSWLVTGGKWLIQGCVMSNST